MTFKLSRRAVLRGMGGVVVGLPVLECMLDGHGNAYADGSGLCRRYGIVFAGQAIGGDGWERDRQRIGGTTRVEAGHFIVPAETGNNYAITTPLQPLTNLKSDFSIVSGLRIPWSATSTDGADVPPGGAFRDFHGGGSSPLLSGVRSTTANFRAQGITSDQVIARNNMGQTTHPSLVLRAQPSWYLSGSSFSGRQYISYSGPAQPIEAQTSPQIAWQSLFSGFTPGDPAAAARADFTKRGRLSVLDLVLDKRQRLTGRVGAADRQRLDQHYDELRALEMRIAATAPMTGGTCVVPMDPGQDPAVGSDNAGSGSDSIETNTGYSNEDLRARLMCDLIHMAFVCDLTRVATLQITSFQSHMNAYAASTAMGTPIRADLHEVGHNGDVDNKGQLAVSTMLKWHITHYAYLMQKLKQTPEGAGNLLDNSVLIFMPEAGHGTQLNDGTSPFATHSVEDMVLLVGGHAGGLRPGKHIASAGQHPARVLISAMQAAGNSSTTLGEVSGTIPELFS